MFRTAMLLLMALLLPALGVAQGGDGAAKASPDGAGPIPVNTTGQITPAQADPMAQASALYNAARKAYYTDGNPSRAAELFEQAYGVDPNADLLYNAARAWEDAKNLSKALELYRRYAKKFPNGDAIGVVRTKTTQLESTLASARPKKSDPPPLPPALPKKTATDDIAKAPQPEPGLSTQKWLAIGAGGLGIASGIVSGVFAAQMSDASNRAKDGNWDFSAKDEWDSSHTATWVTGGIALAGVTTGLVLWFTDDPAGPKTTPTVVPSPAGVTIRW